MTPTPICIPRIRRCARRPISRLPHCPTHLKRLEIPDSTLVLWIGEFGRTPLAEGTTGRDHHPYVFSCWLAGAGIKGGQVLGSSYDSGLRPAESPFDAHDFDATILGCPACI